MNIQGLILDDKILWDVDKDLLDAQEHKVYLISRALTRGDLSDIKAVLKYYSEEDLKAALLKSRTINEKVMYCMSLYLNVDIKEFKCYELIQSGKNFLPGYGS